jgi:hypothetical protein
MKRDSWLFAISIVWCFALSAGILFMAFAQ